MSTPCAACRKNRKKCEEDCVFKPFFPTDEDSDAYGKANAALGRTRIGKLLKEASSPELQKAIASYIRKETSNSPVEQLAQRIKVLAENFIANPMVWDHGTDIGMFKDSKLGDMDPIPKNFGDSAKDSIADGDVSAALGSFLDDPTLEVGSQAFNKALGDQLGDKEAFPNTGYVSPSSESVFKMETKFLAGHDKVSGFHLDAHDQVSGGRSTLSREPFDPQKPISLPSEGNINRIWDQVSGSPMFQNKPVLPYEDWNIDFSELTVVTPVPVGIFGEGKVYRGIWNGTKVMIKEFREQNLTAEISILSYTVPWSMHKASTVSLITEYMERGSLYHLLHMSGQKKSLSWRRKLKMLRDICRGLMCIHRLSIVHRNLKSANCLLSKNYTVKIWDFGLSRVKTETTMTEAISARTPEYMAPELLRNEPFSEKCDIFSLGVIMWEICTLTKPWVGLQPEQVLTNVAYNGARLDIPEGLALGKLIGDCWSEPDKRPSCGEILSFLLDCKKKIL